MDTLGFRREALKAVISIAGDNALLRIMDAVKDVRLTSLVTVGEVVDEMHERAFKEE